MKNNLKSIEYYCPIIKPRAEKESQRLPLKPLNPTAIYSINNDGAIKRAGNQPPGGTSTTRRDINHTSRREINQRRGISHKRGGKSTARREINQTAGKQPKLRRGINKQMTLSLSLLSRGGNDPCGRNIPKCSA